MIHPSAIVANDAEIHPNAYVGPWCIVESGVKIASNVRLVARVRVASGTEIGENTEIYDGCVLGAPPQDLKYANENTSLKIGRNCIIREYCTLNRGTIASGCTEVADNVLLMAYVHVAHDCCIGKGAVIANACQLGGHVQIGKYATLGGTAGVQQRNCIGDYAFVGASLKVDRDVPPAVKALGSPLRFAGLNLHALRRFPNEFPEERIKFLEDSYRELFRSGNTIADSVEKMKKSTEPLLRAFFENWTGNLISR